jgi:hypothetical protein
VSAQPVSYPVDQKSWIEWGPVPAIMEHDYSQRTAAVVLKRTCRESVHQYHQEKPESTPVSERELNDVRARYVFSEPAEVELFLKDHRTIPGLLLEAAAYLRNCFGPIVPLRLTVSLEEDGSRTLQALAVWNGPLNEAKNALARFDMDWWLDNCRRSSGRTIFDYELI